jgi:death-on-curing protein
MTWSCKPPAVQRVCATSGDSNRHETLIEKAAALGFSLVQNHPFVDGNKRTAHAAMETFLVLNGSEIVASVDEQERLMTEVAAGRAARSQLIAWLRDHVRHVS